MKSKNPTIDIAGHGFLQTSETQYGKDCKGTEYALVASLAPLTLNSDSRRFYPEGGKWREEVKVEIPLTKQQYTSLMRKFKASKLKRPKIMLYGELEILIEERI